MIIGYLDPRGIKLQWLHNKPRPTQPEPRGQARIAFPETPISLN